jgi:hypothetical protein
MRAALLLVLIPLIGCVDGGDKGPESDVPVDGKLDTMQAPTEHGVLPFGNTTVASLTAAAGFHTWTFDLSDDADLEVFTAAPYPHAHAVDTVLYLYKQKDNGTWGSYIARNDDTGTHVWSTIDKHLHAGHYRVLVKGYDRTIRGKFALTAECTGTGCTPASTCLFGATYHDAIAQTELNPWVNQLHVGDYMTDLTKAQIVASLRDTGWDVSTVEEAFTHVQDGYINVGHYYETAASTAFVSYEYGSGDNSYGAIFEARSTTMVAQIHDGDLYGCTAVAQVCLLGQTYHDLLESPDYDKDATRAVTSPAQVSAIEGQALVLAVHESWPDVTDVAGALAVVQDGTVNVTTLRHRADGTALTAFEYGAGDNSYGLIVYAGTVTTAAAINDGDLYGCTFYQ